MELLQLRYFQSAAQTQSFAATAKKFVVPASNISQSVHRLEKELGVTLFDRHANSISLNARGAAFYERVDRALSLIDTGVSDLQNTLAPDTIRICVNSNRRIVMQTIEKFKRIDDRVDITARYGCKETEDFDLIISSEGPESAHFYSKKILTEKILLALRADSPLSRSQSITADALRDESFVSMGEQSSIHKMTRRICRDMGFEPHIAIQADDPFYVRRCVEMGLGITLIPSISWKGLFSNDITFISLGDYTRDTFLYKNREKSSSAVLEKFVSMLLEDFASEQNM